MDDFPIETCLHILRFLSRNDYPTWCILGRQYRDIFHVFLRGKTELISGIILQVCRTGNLPYLTLLMEIAIETCPHYRAYWRATYTEESIAAGALAINPATGFEYGMDPTEFMPIGTFMSQEVHMAAAHNHIHIVNYITSLFPLYVQVDVHVHSNTTLKSILSLLDNDRLFVTGAGMRLIPGCIKDLFTSKHIPSGTVNELREKIYAHSRMLDTEKTIFSMLSYTRRLKEVGFVQANAETGYIWSDLTTLPWSDENNDQGPN